MTHSAAALTAILLFAACYEDNTGYQEDAGVACKDSQDCAATAATPVCFDKVCVQCTTAEASECTGTTPVCGDANTCQPCSAHDQCESKACTPSGACAIATEVAYVAPASAGGSDNTDCMSAMPCTKVAAALGTNRPYVLFNGTIIENVVLDGRANITFLAAPGANLRGAATGPVLDVRNGSKLVIADLEISDGLGSMNGHGILFSGVNNAVELIRVKLVRNQTTGLVATNGDVKIRQSLISGNIGGGLSISTSTFDISNSIIYKNGGLISTVGGVAFLQISMPGRFELNTVTQNLGRMGAISGVQCAIVTVPLVVTNSIIYGNNQANVDNNVADQVSSETNCPWTYSIIGPKALTSPGIGVVNSEPQFVSADDLKLQTTSPARDTADPATTIKVDFYGTARPQGTRADLGAIEFK